MLNKSGKSKYLCLVPDFRLKDFSLPSLCNILAMGFLQMQFTRLTTFPSVLIQCFYHERVFGFAKCFSAPVDMIMWLLYIILLIWYITFLKKDFIYFFLERGEGKEKEREGNINVWLPLTCPLLGTCPPTQACALTGNRTCDLLVRRPMLNPLSYTSQGYGVLL